MICKKNKVDRSGPLLRQVSDIRLLPPNVFTTHGSLYAATLPLRTSVRVRLFFHLFYLFPWTGLAGRLWELGRVCQMQQPDPEFKVAGCRSKQAP